MKNLIILLLVLLFAGCSGKRELKADRSSKEVSEKVTLEKVDTVKPSASDIKEVPEVKEEVQAAVETRERIRDFEWYVGTWSKVAYEDYWNNESDTESVELKIKKENEKFTAVLTEGEKVSEGELYVDKYFLPKNLPEEEQLNYDNSDYLVADFNRLRYWISIYYDGSKRDRIALNLDDIDVYILERDE